jgi:hypothetical protein
LTFRFKVAPRAAVQIRAAAEWWAKNRTKNPTGFAEDLESAFMLIQDLPNAGEAVPHRTIPNLRRVLLGLTQHHLYYCQRRSSSRNTRAMAYKSRFASTLLSRLPNSTEQLTGPSLARHFSHLALRS